MQPDLFTHAPRFDGATLGPARDTGRLSAQLARVRALMADGRWRTLSEISRLTGDQTQSVSARLRDLKKPRFGGWTVTRQYLARGLYQYRVTR